MCPLEGQFLENSIELGISNNLPSESIKCKCRSQNICQWEQKGKSCFTKSSFRNNYFENQIGKENSEIAPPQSRPNKVDQFELIDFVNSPFHLGQNSIQNILNSLEGTIESGKNILLASDLLAGNSVKNSETAEQLGNFFDIQQLTKNGPVQFYFINKL